MDQKKPRAKIEQWYLVPSSYDSKRPGHWILKGRVESHPVAGMAQPDQWLHSTRVIFFDRKTAETLNTIYELGTPQLGRDQVEPFDHREHFKA